MLPLSDSEREELTRTDKSEDFSDITSSLESKNDFYEHGEAKKPEWPKLAEEALYGLSGEMVKTISPYSEADPAALLANILVGFGNIIGHGPHFKVEFTHHYTNLFVVLVGETASGRKGSSWSAPKFILSHTDETWAKNSIKSGLSSGEGLIYHIRDSRTEKQPIKENKKIIEYQDVLVDEGIEDKRLLIIEEEFVTVLKVSYRQGNILSDVIRQAWDCRTLMPLIKTNPTKASNPHVSIVGHITKQELERYLAETEKANGFANRFIWLLVKRSKLISNPTGVPQNLLTPLIQKLNYAVESARKIEIIIRDQEAETLWDGIYGPLSEGKLGMLGAITARSVPQVMRLACLYALMDESSVIRAPHLKAALAFWDYSEASVKNIFDSKIGDPIADKIMGQMSKVGEMSQNDIYELFNGHIKSDERDRILNYLEALGKIHKRIIKTSGRDKTVWSVA